MLTSFRKQDGEENKVVGNMGATRPGQATPPNVGLSQPSAALARPAASDPPNLHGTDRAPPSVIGPDLVITGNLTSKGQMQIDGEVQGDINGSHVIIGERARITGGIRAEEVVVRGKVLGAIHSNRVMLQANSHVEGDVFHKALAIEQGAYFEGKSRRSDDPLSETGDASAHASPVPISVPSAS